MLKPIREAISSRYREEGGYKELLALAVPLVLSSGAWSIQHFVDRMFLTWYSPEAVAASMPAGILNFTIMSFFLGTAGYASTFVAQYYGAKRYERVGPSVWQGVYVGMLGGLFLLAFVPLADEIFAAVGHAPAVQRYETEYFRILCLGSSAPLISSAFGAFFLGLGRSVPVMAVNVASTAVNLVLDYLLIFGKLGLPALGIRGAALATVAAGVVSLILYLLLLTPRDYRQRYRIFSGWRLDPPLFRRLLRFGLPNGVQFFLDIFAFTAFVLIVGRLGTVPLAATNIAFNINTLAFMPMIGFGMAVSILVGQRLGEDRPDLAERSVYSGFHLTFTYMASVAALYVLVPGLFLAPFAAQADPEAFRPIRETTVVLLRFVAVYSLFDTMNIIFASAIKGAGDTRFVMRLVVLASLFLFVLPTYMVVVHLGLGIRTAWTVASVYIIVLGLSFLARFLGGKWKSMRVIEPTPAAVPAQVSEAPVV